MKKIFFLFSLLFIIGCGHKEVVVHKPKPMPQWYLNPPKDTSRYVYVTGVGITKKEATLNALSNFISRYSVTISSEFNKKSQYFGGGLSNKNMSYNIKAAVKKFEVTNYEIVKAQQYSFDKFLVLIRVDVQKLYEDLASKLDDRFKTYQMEFKAILKENPVKKLVDLKKFYNKIKKEITYIYILKTMNNNFNEKKYLSFINKVKNTLLSLQNSIKIEVISNNSVVASDVRRYLIANNVKIGKSNVKLIINVKRKLSNAMNLIVYEVYVTLKYKGNIIGSNFFKIVVPHGTNLNNYLYDEIKDYSLEKFFNFQ